MSRLPPQSVESEQAVLGGLMLAPDTLHIVSGVLTQDDFYRRDHALIWRAIRHLESKGKPFDAVTLGDWFVAQGLADQVDNGAYLIELASTTPSAANIRAYAEIVADKAKLRRAIDIGGALMDSGFEPNGRESLEIITDAAKALGELTGIRAASLKSVNQGLDEMVDDMQRRMQSGAMPGISYGLPALDYMTGGRKPGDLIILAARPSMGKTTLAIQGALNSKRPLIFSFETTASQLLARMTAHVGKLPLQWITNPQSAPDEAFAKIMAAAAAVQEKMRGRIYDGRRLTFEQMRAIAISEHNREPITEIVTDHLGHVRVSGKGRLDLEQGEVTKGHKELGKELGVPATLLMQLNRGVESRADKRPMLSDLRECGAAEEDADVVVMLYRDEYYNREPNNPLRGFSEFFLRKNRDGEPGECWAHARLEEMRFEQAEPQQRSVATVEPVGGRGGVSSRYSPRSQPRTLARAGGDD
jgi:replicative DNA helicase